MGSTKCRTRRRSGGGKPGRRRNTYSDFNPKTDYDFDYNTDSSPYAHGNPYNRKFLCHTCYTGGNRRRYCFALPK